MAYTKLPMLGGTTALNVTANDNRYTNEKGQTVAEAAKEAAKEARANSGYFNPFATSISAQNYKEFGDAIRNIPDGRNVMPLSYYEGVEFAHRDSVYDMMSYTRIGDCLLMIPPTFIGVFNQGKIEEIPSIRQNGTTKTKQGYQYRDVIMTLFFCGLDQINGHAYPSPHQGMTYYMDGLRALIAQFKTSPFLPIQNILLNTSYGIHTVALSSMDVQTVEGFPDCLEVTLTLSEFNSSVYLEIPEPFFTDLVEWDLYRYGYQRLLNNPKQSGHIPTASAEHSNRYSISIINQEVFSSDKMELLKKTKLDDAFIQLLDETSGLHLVKLSFGLSNVLPQIEMPAHAIPVIQYMGCTDTSVQMVFETLDTLMVAKVEQIVEQFRYLSREYRDYNHVGFLKFDNEYTRLTGTQYFVVDQVESTTVPEFPGLFKIALTLIGFDIRNEGDETLKGMRPFDRKGIKQDTITQSYGGIMNRIKQDNYIERKMMEEFELYPDLKLPTYKEINVAIEEIQTYRKARSLPLLNYNHYPEPKSIIPGQTLDGTYTTFLDPDYYMMYPLSYSDMSDEYMGGLAKEMKATGTPKVIPDLETGDRLVIDKRNAYFEANQLRYDAQSNLSQGPKGTVIPIVTTSLNASATNYVKLLKEQVGAQYVSGAAGSYGALGLQFDCSGLVCWGLWRMGLWKDSKGEGMRFTTHSFLAGSKAGYWREISFAELQPGDICLIKQGEQGAPSNHAGVYIGKDENGVHRTVEAMSPAKGVAIGWIKDNRKAYFTRFMRVTAFETGVSPRSSTVNSPLNLDYPENEAEMDENGNLYRPSKAAKTVQMNMQFDPKVTVKALEANFIDGMVGTGAMIHHAANQHNVDPALLAAIAKHETNHGKSSAYVDRNNPGGMMDPKTGSTVLFTYPDIETGYDKMASNLDRNYIQDGRRTIATIGPKYCPINAANDPNKLNKYWIGNVTKFFNEIKATAYGMTVAQVEAATKSTSDTHYGWGNGSGADSSIWTSQSVTDYTTARQAPVDVPFGYEEVENLNSSWKQDRAGETVNDQENELTDFKRMGEPYVQLSPLSDYLFSDTERKKAKDSLEGISRKATILGDDYNSFYLPPAYVEGRIQSYYTTSKLREYGVYDDYSDGVGELGNRFIEKMCKENLLSYMCVDMKQFGCKGRLLRAFPTFVFMVVDDSGEWLDGRRLWSNYYLYRSIISIQLFQEEAQPIHTANILINDSFDRLSTSPKYPYEIYQQTFIENDKELFQTPVWGRFKKFWYEWTGSLLGGPKVTESVVNVKNTIHDSIKIKPGCRLHIRMGYGSNPIQIPVVFNGVVAEMEQDNHYLQLVAQSDGAQLLQNVVSSKKNDTNSFMYLQSEPSNILVSLLTERNNKYTNMMNAKWGEPNKFGIENFGINIKGLELKRYQHDLNMNIHVGRYTPQHFTKSVFLNFDGEENFNMFLYGKYPWDVMQMCALTLPEFVCQPVYHQFESRIFYGLPFFPYRYRYDWIDTDEITSVFESAKIFAQNHVLHSLNDIVSNKIKTSNKNLKTNIVGLYTLGGSSKTTPTIYSDRTIDWSKQTTGIVDTTVVQDYFGIDLIYAATLWDIGRTAAIKMGTSTLLDGWSKTYRGELIILGDTSIKPCDFIFLNDTFHDMSGKFRVRQVIHSMSGDKGFTTSIVPGMIAMSTEQNSGSLNVYKSILSMDAALACNSTARELLLSTYRHFGGLLKTSNTIDWILKRSAIQHTGAVSKTVWNAFKTGSLVGDYKASIAVIKESYKTAKELDNFQHFISGGKVAIQTGKTVKDLTLAAQTGITTAAGSVVPVIGHIVAWIATEIAINTVLTWITDQFQYDNCIKLLPMTYKGSAFVVSSKGAKNLLLMDDNAIENTSMNGDEEEEVEVN